MAVLLSASPFLLITTGWGEGRSEWLGGQCSIREYMYTFIHGQSAFTEVTLIVVEGRFCHVTANARQQHTLGLRTGFTPLPRKRETEKGRVVVNEDIHRGGDISLLLTTDRATETAKIENRSNVAQFARSYVSTTDERQCKQLSAVVHSKETLLSVLSHCGECSDSLLLQWKVHHLLLAHNASAS